MFNLAAGAGAATAAVAIVAVDVDVACPVAFLANFFDLKVLNGDMSFDDAVAVVEPLVPAPVAFKLTTLLLSDDVEILYNSGE